MSRRADAVIYVPKCCLICLEYKTTDKPLTEPTASHVLQLKETYSNVLANLSKRITKELNGKLGNLIPILIDYTKHNDDQEVLCLVLGSGEGINVDTKVQPDEKTFERVMIKKIGYDSNAIISTDFAVSISLDDNSELSDRNVNDMNEKLIPFTLDESMKILNPFCENFDNVADCVTMELCVSKQKVNTPPPTMSISGTEESVPVNLTIKQRTKEFVLNSRPPTPRTSLNEVGVGRRNFIIQQETMIKSAQPKTIRCMWDACQDKLVFHSIFVPVTTKSLDFYIGFVPMLQNGAGFEKHESILLKYIPRLSIVQCPHSVLTNVPIDLRSAVNKMNCPCVMKFGKKVLFLKIHDLLYKHVCKTFDSWGKLVNLYMDNAKNISDASFRNDSSLESTSTDGDLNNRVSQQMKIWTDDFKQQVGICNQHELGKSHIVAAVAAKRRADSPADGSQKSKSAKQ
ncbi:hypothetical protein EGW08_020734 [Elysia chlorotica]|uniref:Uncharacterized protein n=1 Tax=Elysia chlorotica TaxID=188477 RepID=A0A433SQG7_ELYCH|nr:hypothetical protein EGW08_020734 [Elysia chlorotica]